MQMLVMDLSHALELYPPPQPTRSAVDLLVTVGKHQEYLVTHSLLPAHDHPGSLDALKVCSAPILMTAVINSIPHTPRGNDCSLHAVPSI